MLNNIEKNEIVIANAETVNTNSEKRLLGVNYGLADIQAVDIDTSLLKSRSEELRLLEERVKQGMGVAGSALKRIRDKKLYKAEFKTFGKYCQDRFKISKAHAYRLIDFAKTCEAIQEDPGAIPEKITRPLAKLPDDEAKREVWQEVRNANEGKLPSEADVNAAVQARLNQHGAEVNIAGQLYSKRLEKNFAMDNLASELIAETNLLQEGKSAVQSSKRSAKVLLDVTVEFKKQLSEDDKQMLKDEYLRRMSTFFDQSVN
ncbi:MAG: hypothetical protein E7057_01105 [Lentisphaerae bacterium]|nr:hypothetical protein [Lentisphaerota bacterium]MBE6388328.1 hypothetical protein [Lentisphaerota bacterium]